MGQSERRTDGCDNSQMLHVDLQMSEQEMVS
jgi:hypothetical protein